MKKEAFQRFLQNSFQQWNTLKSEKYPSILLVHALQTNYGELIKKLSCFGSIHRYKTNFEFLFKEKAYYSAVQYSNLYSAVLFRCCFYPKSSLVQVMSLSFLLFRWMSENFSGEELVALSSSFSPLPWEHQLLTLWSSLPFLAEQSGSIKTTMSRAGQLAILSGVATKDPFTLEKLFVKRVSTPKYTYGSIA